MKAGRIAWVLGPTALLGLALLAEPAVSQTTQAKPGAPAASSISPSAGAGGASTPGSSGSAASRAPGGGAAKGSSSAANYAPIDINTASATELDALPGIGPARADAIVKNRPFRAKDDLVNRHILPQSVYDGIKDRIIARRG